MNDLRKLMDDIISQDEELQKEVDLLKLKYDIIDELISYRKMNNLTQSDFAKVIGVKQQMISRFEKGEVDPRLSFISKVLFGMKKVAQTQENSEEKAWEEVSKNMLFKNFEAYKELAE